MRACFLGQNICALGYGVAMLQTPPLPPGEPPVDEMAANRPWDRPAECVAVLPICSNSATLAAPAGLTP